MVLPPVVLSPVVLSSAVLSSVLSPPVVTAPVVFLPVVVSPVSVANAMVGRRDSSIAQTTRMLRIFLFMKTLPFKKNFDIHIKSIYNPFPDIVFPAGRSSYTRHVLS